MPYKFIYIIANGKIFFFFYGWMISHWVYICVCVSLCVCVCVYIFPICSPIEQHLGCLHILATVKDAVVGIGLHMSHEILISIPLNIHSGVVLLDNMLVQF